MIDSTLSTSMGPTALVSDQSYVCCTVRNVTRRGLLQGEGLKYCYLLFKACIVFADLYLQPILALISEL